MIVIHGRQSSHYTRLVRLFAHELDVPVVLAPIHALLSEDPATFAGNPALKLPALRDGDAVVWGSMNACRWLARRSAAGEGAVAWPEDATSPLALNAHELVAHAMATEVEVVFHEIVSQRPPDDASRKRRASLESTLDWLDANVSDVRAALPARRLRWFEPALFALLEHFPFRNPTVTLDRRPALRAFVAEFGARPSAQATPYVFDPPPAKHAAADATHAAVAAPDAAQAAVSAPDAAQAAVAAPDATQAAVAAPDAAPTSASPGGVHAGG